MEKITDLINEAEDISNELVYRNKDWEQCEMVQHTVDVWRDLVHELLAQNERLRDNISYNYWDIWKQ